MIRRPKIIGPPYRNVLASWLSEFSFRWFLNHSSFRRSVLLSVDLIMKGGKGLTLPFPVYRRRWRSAGRVRAYIVCGYSGSRGPCALSRSRVTAVFRKSIFNFHRDKNVNSALQIARVHVRIVLIMRCRRATGRKSRSFDRKRKTTMRTRPLSGLGDVRCRRTIMMWCAAARHGVVVSCQKHGTPVVERARVHGNDEILRIQNRVSLMV